MTKVFFALLFIGVAKNTFAQIDIVDSLKNELNKINKEPNSVTKDTITLNILSGLIENIYEDEVWGEYNKQVKIISKKLLNDKDLKVKKKAKLFMALCINDEGMLLINQGKFVEAKEAFFESKKQLETLNEPIHLAMALHNLGYIFKNEGNLVKALQYYLKSLKIREKINDEAGIALSLNNIGLIYDMQDDKQTAKTYFERSVVIFEKIDDKYGLSNVLNNLALCYSREGYYPKAIELYSRCKSIQLGLGDKIGVAYTYNNMGTVFQADKKYDVAFEYYNKALDVFREVNNEEGVSWSLHNIANTFAIKKNFKQAMIYLDSSLVISKKIKNQELIRNSEGIYAQIDSSIGNFNGAFEHYKNYIYYRDEIINIDNKNNNLQQRLNYEFDKKEAILKEQQERERVVSQEKNHKQKVIIWSVIAVLILVFLFTLFVLRTLRLTRKQKEIIEKQKGLVEEKQKEILDSIHYAKRIQDAILTSQTYIERNMKRLRK